MCQFVCSSQPTKQPTVLKKKTKAHTNGVLLRFFFLCYKFSLSTLLLHTNNLTKSTEIIKKIHRKRTQTLASYYLFKCLFLRSFAHFSFITSNVNRNCFFFSFENRDHTQKFQPQPVALLNCASTCSITMATIGSHIVCVKNKIRHRILYFSKLH